MDHQLAGRVAVVTGADGSTGRAIARALADEGATVIAAAASRISAEEEVLGGGGRVVPIEADLAHPVDIEQIKQRAQERGGLDILVNNVGAVTPRMTGFLTVGDQIWRQSMEVNFFAPLMVTRFMLPLLLESDRAAVVSISATNAALSDPTVVDYSAGNAAMSHVMKSLSKEYGAHDIRFNTISPGAIGAGGRVRAGLSAEQFSKPEEIAALVIGLAGRTLREANGSDFVIDGDIVKTA